MNLIFPGTGSAFTIKNYQTSMIIRHNDKNFLIDAGMDIRFSLNETGMSYKDIDAMYITHLHADHAGGVEYLAFANYFDPSCEQPIQLFGNSELLRKGWKQTWRGGLESVQGKVMGLNDYFDVNMIRDNGSFTWEGLTFNIVQSVHIMNGYAIVPTYGLMITIPGDDPSDVKDGHYVKPAKKIFYTGDTQFAPNQLKDFYNEADLIIQDCETLYKSGVHAHYDELKTLDDSIKKKMLFVHYQDNISMENFDEWQDKAIIDGFNGEAFVPRGLQVELNNLIH